jgi:hypothetical protein|tara:strand:- start:35 stop:613 length:579 start_codon:yes stop_codon:yes gene_type:complete
VNKKILIQFFLILIIFCASFIFYKVFFTNPILELENKISENKNDEKKKTNMINDITYKSVHSGDNSYIIKAEFGEIDKDNQDFMLLTNVKGKFFFKDSDMIEISSEKAYYDSLNYNTNFYQNVLIVFKDHQINSDNFDLSFDKKLGTIYSNIIYKNLNTVLRADKVDINLITKDSKIYMLDKSKKVKIKYLN